MHRHFIIRCTIDDENVAILFNSDGLQSRNRVRAIVLTILSSHYYKARKEERGKEEKVNDARCAASFTTDCVLSIVVATDLAVSFVASSRSSIPSPRISRSIDATARPRIFIGAPRSRNKGARRGRSIRRTAGAHILCPEDDAAASRGPILSLLDEHDERHRPSIRGIDIRPGATPARSRLSCLYAGPSAGPMCTSCGF